MMTKHSPNVVAIAAGGALGTAAFVLFGAPLWAGIVVASAGALAVKKVLA
jgi:uncharacterized protein (DUF58 family)